MVYVVVSIGDAFEDGVVVPLLVVTEKGILRVSNGGRVLSDVLLVCL